MSVQVVSVSGTAVGCPACGGPTRVQRNGDWRCVRASRSLVPPVVEYLCPARGVTLDGELVMTAWPAHGDALVIDDLKEMAA